MTELRWVLLALGVALILGIYAASRGWPQHWFAKLQRIGRRGLKAPRVEPGLDMEDSSTDTPVAMPDAAWQQDAPSEPEAVAASTLPESVITIRFVPHEREIASDRVILALRAAGLTHGKYGIFHKHESALSDEPLFSVASLTEPGSFDLSRLAETKIAGTSFFMVLPGIGDPVEGPSSASDSGAGVTSAIQLFRPRWWW